MNEHDPYDLVVLGGGSAGHAAAATACALGLRTALVEGAHTLGGLCILSGCMPSKTLIETANRLREMREASRFGIRPGPCELDEQALRERLNAIIADFKQHRVAEMRDGRYDLLRGHGVFVSPKEIRIDRPDQPSRIIKSDAFVIATGSSPHLPEIPGLPGTPFWTSKDVSRLPAIPPRIAIVGAGSVGMEFAHLFEGLGTREVTLILRGGKVLGDVDPEISSELEAASRDRGIRFLKHTSPLRVCHRTGDGVFEITLSGQSAPLEAEALLMATGRRPNTSGIGLNAIGIAMDGGRILIDDRCATSIPHIFAAGDCASSVPVVHLAVLQGEAAARNAARLDRSRRSLEPAEWNRNTAMVAWFTEPQCVQIGHSESSLRDKLLSVQSARYNYADQGKGIIHGTTRGFVKLIADATTGRLLGASAVGPQVVETAHSISTAIHAGMTAADFAALPHYHPTFAEAWSRAAEALVEKLTAAPSTEGAFQTAADD